MSEWKEVQLNETCNLIAGYAFKSKDFGNYPTKVLKIADINPPFVSSEKSSGVDLSNYDVDKLDKYIVKKGDYILAMTGATIGKLGRYVSDEHAYLNQRVLKFQPYQSIDSNFLYYVLCGRLFAKYIINHIDSESAQPNISAGTIGKYRFNLPDFKTQQEIASILSSLDSKIENNRKICANLEAQAQALFKHWFIDFAPFKDGKFVESELGMIPEGWRVGRLGELIEIKYGKDHKKLKEGAIPAYGSAGLMRYVDSSLYKGESVLIPRKGTLNNVMLVNEAFWTVDTMFYTIPKYEHLLKYVFLKLSRIDFTKLNVGTSIPSNSTDQLNKLSIVIPPNNVLKTFDKLLNDIFVIKRHKIEESSRLTSLRDTLLPKLMSGAIKV